MGSSRELRIPIDARARGGRGRWPRLRPVPVVQPRGELAGLLTVSYQKVHCGHGPEEAVLSRARCRGYSERLCRRFAPLRKLLLIGPRARARR